MSIIISRGYCTLFIFCLASLSFNNCFHANKPFTIFTGMRRHSLWLSSHNSTRLCRFFWRTLLFSSVYICLIPDIGIMVRVFANGLGDLGSIPGRVIPKTQKMVLEASLLNTQHYKVRIKGKVEQSRERVVPSPTPLCCSCRKGSPWVTLDFGRQLYFAWWYLSQAS